MKQKEIIVAYQTAEKLTECDLSPKEQWDIYQLRLFLRPHIEFQTEREESIRKKYIEFADENGNLKGEYAVKYFADLKNLEDLEVELKEREKIKIRFVKGITCKIIEPLENFIEFIPPDA